MRPASPERSPTGHSDDDGSGSSKPASCLTRIAVDRERAVQQLHAFAHPEQPESTARVGAGIEARPVVLDHDHEPPGIPRHDDADVLRSSVLDDVRDRFLHDAIDGRLDLR